jgi:TRAP-type C4-dicarboxylate transport system substrate-binding protein
MEPSAGTAGKDKKIVGNLYARLLSNGALDHLSPATRPAFEQFLKQGAEEVANKRAEEERAVEQTMDGIRGLIRERAERAERYTAVAMRSKGLQVEGEALRRPSLQLKQRAEPGEPWTSL